MKQSKVHSFILFSLGAWFEEANKHIEDKPLQVSISKKTFIELVMNAGIARKQERALYKNLETLEKKKLISYENTKNYLDFFVLSSFRAFVWFFYVPGLSRLGNILKFRI